MLPLPPLLLPKEPGSTPAAAAAAAAAAQAAALVAAARPLHCCHAAGAAAARQKGIAGVREIIREALWGGLSTPDDVTGNLHAHQQAAMGSPAQPEQHSTASSIMQQDSANYRETPGLVAGRQQQRIQQMQHAATVQHL